MILVASVHHTGTKVIFNDILRDLPEINQQLYDETGHSKIRIHIDPVFKGDLHHWLKRAKTIVPLRHPRTVAIGWKSRFKPLWDLEAQWDLLKNEIDKYNPFYIPVDDIETRDDWLHKVNLELELKLNTNWPVIGQHGGEYLPLNGDDERRVQTWMADGFFGRFGYE